MYKDAGAFHLERIAFAFVEGKIVVTVRDSRGHKEWLSEDFGVGTIEFELITRGYIKGNEITLYKSSAFEPIELCYLSLEMIKDILEIAEQYLGKNEYTIYNGVIVGEVGEVWEPKHMIGKFELSKMA